MKTVLWAAGIVVLLSGVAVAQSMLEYSALSTATAAAAAKASKGKTQSQGQEEAQASSGEDAGFVQGAMEKVYGDSSQMMSSKSAHLLGQVGGPVQIPAAAAPESPSVSPARPAEAPAEAAADADSLVTLTLKTGQVVKGKLIDQNKDYVRIDIQGVAMTYFRDEIKKVE